MIDPAKYRFHVWRGGTFRKNLTLLNEDETPKVLTNYTGELVIRETPGPESETNPVLFTMTTLDGGIDFGGPNNDGANGVIQLFIDSDDTATFAWSVGYYELKITAPNPDDTDVLLYGSFTVQG